MNNLLGVDAVEVKKTKRILELEEKISMDLGEWLKQKYIHELKPTTWIMDELEISSHTIVKYFKSYGIQARKPSERYKVWWENSSEAEKIKFTNDLSERAKKNLVKNRDTPVKYKRKEGVIPIGMTLKEYMQTSEYKRKMSKANSGEKNGMHKDELTEEHRVEKRGIYGYKKWSKQVRERDNHTCKACGKSKGDVKMMVAHHLESYDTCEELRLDLDNGVTLCNSCHHIFHNKYRGQKTTRKQFENYLEEVHS